MGPAGRCPAIGPAGSPAAPCDPSSGTATHERELPAPAAALAELSRSHGIASTAILAAAVTALLARYSGQEDVSLSTVSPRSGYAVVVRTGVDTADIHATCLRDGTGAAMAKFIAMTSRKGPFPDNGNEEPVPAPADFGLPAQDDGSRDDPLLGQNMLGCTGYRPDFAALQAASTRVVVAAGKESDGEFAARAAAEIAARLGTGPAVFPGDHGGFLGREFGRHGAPAEFAQTLRKVLRTDR